MSTQQPLSWTCSVFQRLSEKEANSWAVRFHRIIGGTLIFLGLGFVVLPLSHILAEPEAPLYSIELPDDGSDGDEINATELDRLRRNWLRHQDSDQ